MQPNPLKKHLILVNQSQPSQFYLKKKKLVKLSKVIAQQQKTIANPIIVHIKSSIIQHPKSSHKLCKTIKQAEKIPQVVGADIPLYSEQNK